MYKGVRGYYIQSKINSKSIFLPMGGGMYGESIIYDDSGAYYWSATRSSNEYAYRLYTYFDMIDPQNTDPIYIGFPIRPVEDFTFEELADAFKTKHATVLALDVKDVTVDDRKPVSKALSEYSKLSSEAQALLTKEKAKLDALMAAIPSGAPSSVTFVQLYENGPKWANMNIGASSVTDAGDYFWWGDVEGHANGEAFKFSSSNAAITSYNNNDGYVADGKLVTEKDAATQNWGNGYRMPTSADFKDLTNNCDWSWQENYNGAEGVKGYLVSGKGDYAGNSIFLPAAGALDEESLVYEGYGYYWSSAISYDAIDALTLHFYPGITIPDYNFGRYLGFSVRAVSE